MRDLITSILIVLAIEVPLVIIGILFKVPGSSILGFGILGIGLIFFMTAFIKDNPGAKRNYKIGAGIFVLLVPFIMSTQAGLTGWIPAFNSVLLYSIMAIGLNLLLGNAGQISLGHAGFYAVGAYAAAILSVFAGFPLILSIVVGAIITAMFGFILGTPILRLKGHFLGIATLGMHVVIEHLVKDDLKILFTGDKVPGKFLVGSSVSNISYSLRETLAVWDYNFQVLGEAKPFYYGFVQNMADSMSEIAIFFLSLLLLVLIVYMARNLLRTKIGRALGALRDSEVAARALGVNITLYKNIAFALSAFFAGIAGGIFSLSIGTMAESSFPITISLTVLAMIVVGGLGAIQGAIIGAALFELLDKQIIKIIVGSDPNLQTLTPAILGLLVVLMIIFAPKGIVYMLHQLKLKVSQKRS